MSSTYLPAAKIALAAFGTICDIELSREEILYDLYQTWSKRRAWWKRTPRYTKGTALRLLPDYLAVIVEQHQIIAMTVADELHSLANAAIGLTPAGFMEVSAEDFAVVRDHWESK
jgi:hypothetical protein